MTRPERPSSHPSTTIILEPLAPSKPHHSASLTPNLPFGLFAYIYRAHTNKTDDSHTHTHTNLARRIQPSPSRQTV